jgi:hypothetical protein
MNTQTRFLTLALFIEERDALKEGASWERHFFEFLFVIFYVPVHVIALS